MLLVHSEIHYVPIGDGWDEVLVRNVLHYVPVLLSLLFSLFSLGNPEKRVMGAASGIKAPTRFELMISCLLHRRLNQLSHSASQ